jgi:hypothetical protein
MAAQTKSAPMIAAGRTIKRTTSARTTIPTYEPFPAKTNRMPYRGQSAAEHSSAGCSSRGLFNLVEGISNHEILGLHHVREGAGHQTAYDLGFFLFGELFVLGGWLLTRFV